MGRWTVAGPVHGMARYNRPDTSLRRIPDTNFCTGAATMKVTGNWRLQEWETIKTRTISDFVLQELRSTNHQMEMGSHAANASEHPDMPWHACHVTKLQWMVKLRVHHAAEWQGAPVLRRGLKRPSQLAPPKLLKIPIYFTFGTSLCAHSGPKRA